MTSTLKRQVALRIVGLALLIPAITAGTASAGRVASSKGNGAYMYVSGSDASGCVWFYLYASRGGTKAAPKTWMGYDVYKGCTSNWIAYGWGEIANTSFKATNKGATLAITPSATASFYVEGATGSITIELTGDGLWSYSYSGHSRSEYAGHVYQSHGAWSSQSAKATGTVLGFAIGNVYASFGDGRDKYMEIDRGSN